MSWLQKGLEPAEQVLVWAMALGDAFRVPAHGGRSEGMVDAKPEEKQAEG